MIIYGWRKKLVKAFYMGIQYCPHCRKFQHMYGYRVLQQITIFFIPVFWWTIERFSGCGICNYGHKYNKTEFKAAYIKYENYPTFEQTNMIFEFCADMAKGRENTEENVQKLFSQVKERFDLKGFDDDFMRMIQNIFIVQEYQANQPQIVE